MYGVHLQKDIPEQYSGVLVFVEQIHSESRACDPVDQPAFHLYLFKSKQKRSRHQRNQKYIQDLLCGPAPIHCLVNMIPIISI